MELTDFESEIIDSLLWQVKGFKNGHVSERATKRILRASIRRIKSKNIGFSSASENETKNDEDHAVPVKVIIQMIMDSKNIDRASIIEILDKFFVSVTITKKEHKETLKNNGLESDMPNDWDFNDPFARYKSVGIKINEIK